MTSKFQLQVRSFAKLVGYTLFAPMSLLVLFLAFGEAGLPEPPDWVFWSAVGLLGAVWLASAPFAYRDWKEERKYSNPSHAVELRVEGNVQDIEVDSLRSMATKALTLEGVRPPSGVSILVTDDEGFQDRDGSKGQAARDGVLTVASEEDDLLDPQWGFQRGALGEVVISVDAAGRQATENGSSIHDELERLLVHGILHLIGYDHRYPSEEEAMRAELEAILELHRQDRAPVTVQA